MPPEPGGDLSSQCIINYETRTSAFKNNNISNYNKKQNNLYYVKVNSEQILFGSKKKSNNE